MDQFNKLKFYLAEASNVDEIVKGMNALPTTQMSIRQTIILEKFNLIF